MPNETPTPEKPESREHSGARHRKTKERSPKRIVAVVAGAAILGASGVIAANHPDIIPAFGSPEVGPDEMRLTATQLAEEGKVPRRVPEALQKATRAVVSIDTGLPGQDTPISGFYAGERSVVTTDTAATSWTKYSDKSDLFLPICSRITARKVGEQTEATSFASQSPNSATRAIGIMGTERTLPGVAILPLAYGVKPPEIGQVLFAVHAPVPGLPPEVRVGVVASSSSERYSLLLKGAYVRGKLTNDTSPVTDGGPLVDAKGNLKGVTAKQNGGIIGLPITYHRATNTRKKATYNLRDKNLCASPQKE